MTVQNFDTIIRPGATCRVWCALTDEGALLGVGYTRRQAQAHARNFSRFGARVRRCVIFVEPTKKRRG